MEADDLGQPVPWSVSSGLGRNGRMLWSTRTHRKSVLDLFRQVKDRAIARLEEDRVMHQQAPVSVTKLGTKIEPNEASTILLVTTWRSGSTFVSELIAQIPGTFYSFEPLITFGHFIPGANSTLKSNYLSDIFQCHFPQSYLDYHQSSTSNLTGTFNFWLPLNNFKRMYQPIGSDLDTYTRYLALKGPSEYMFSQNFRVWEACQSVQNLGDDWNLCYNATLFNDLCQMYPVRLVKVIRGSVQEFSGMLSQFERLRIVFLARDPRGIVNSRRHVDWCEEDCMDLTSLCQGLDDNLDSIHALAQDFPSQIYFLRYEDLCLEPETHVTSLFSFLGHPVTAPIKKYILSHMTSSDKEMHGTRKVSKNRVFQWAQDLDVAKIRAIEGHCHSFMDKA
eukprot:maker-scaffold576_size132709-snap-gene-0.19 protein:Tk05426 transcript:maker-scaffold576_size132709-snap-gene-0.19-mRNA-1 annotation:"hypothetical protein DAPPUDRAFT_53049"